MSLAENFRTMDKRLRLMLLATALLLVLGIGQFIAIRDLNTAGQFSSLALLFAMAGIFLLPTSVILSTVILYVNRRDLRAQRQLLVLGALNLILAINLIWFIANTCTWASAFGLAIRTCH